MYCCGRGIDKIAAVLERSKTFVWLFNNIPERYTEATRSGRSTKLSPTEKRLLLREARKVDKSAGQLCSKLDLPITKKRVHQI